MACSMTNIMQGFYKFHCFDMQQTQQGQVVAALKARFSMRHLARKHNAAG